MTDHPPTRVRLGQRTYTINIDDTGRLRDRASNGETYNDLRQITVSAHLDAEPMREVVVHELLHALTEYTGLYQDLEDPDATVNDEQLVGRLAPALVDLLRSNPMLVAWLQED